MKKNIVLIAFALGGCPSGDGPSNTVEDLCYRADECNYLNTSVEECISDRQFCLDQLPESYQADWADMIQECLDRQSCDLAFDCYLQVPWC